MEEWSHIVLSRWFPIRKQMEKKRLVRQHWWTLWWWMASPTASLSSRGTCGGNARYWSRDGLRRCRRRKLMKSGGAWWPPTPPTMMAGSKTIVGGHGCAIVMDLCKEVVLTWEGKRRNLWRVRFLKEEKFGFGKVFYCVHPHLLHPLFFFLRTFHFCFPLFLFALIILLLSFIGCTHVFSLHPSLSTLIINFCSVHLIISYYLHPTFY